MTDGYVREIEYMDSKYAASVVKAGCQSRRRIIWLCWRHPLCVRKAHLAVEMVSGMWMVFERFYADSDDWLERSC